MKRRKDPLMCFHYEFIYNFISIKSLAFFKPLSLFSIAFTNQIRKALKRNIPDISIEKLPVSKYGLYY